MISWVLALLACGPRVDCDSADANLAQADGRALRCGQAAWAVDYVELLAGRPVPPGDERLGLAEVRERWQRDPAGTSAWLEQVRSAGWALSTRQGPQGVEARAQRVWAAQAGRDVITEQHGDLWNIQKRALSIWSVSDEHQIALTESDIEGWIRYASLCREAQQGGVLRISVADRVTVYRMAQERFQAGTRAEQLAMTTFGAYWEQIRDNWQAASFERQQAWVAEAPLPPPMTATSLGYAQAIFDGSVETHARVVHEKLGPFILGGREPKFREEARPE